MSTISRFPVAMKGLGGEEELSHLTSNQGPIEQPELSPMPKGYGTVKFPHLVWQPGFAVLAASVIDFRWGPTETVVEVGGG